LGEGIKPSTGDLWADGDDPWGVLSKDVKEDEGEDEEDVEGVFFASCDFLDWEASNSFMGEEGEERLRPERE